MAGYIAIDTETTGLPKSRQDASPDNISSWNQCRVLSLAIVKYSSRGRELDHFYELVYPDTFQVAATEIHGITEEDAKTKGKPFEEVYAKLVEYIKKCPVVVGHNLKFDMDVILSEAYRRGLDVTPLLDVRRICTLDLAKKRFMRPMKLTVLYKELTGKDFEGAHNALCDTRACGEVFPMLMGDGRVYKDLSVKKVIIKASEVAAAIGLNQFKKPQEVLEEMWKKVSPQTFHGQTKEDVALATINTSETLQKVLKHTETMTTGDVKNNLKNLFAVIEGETSITDESLQQVKDHVRKVMYTNHGIRSEDVTADLDENKLERDETFYSHDICIIRGTTYQIVGRVDRMQRLDDGSKMVVEIKNRANGLFHKVRDYENVQVQAYLQMTGIKYGRLVEQFGNTRKQYLIEKNDEYWENDVIPKLENFCKNFHSSIV